MEENQPQTAETESSEQLATARISNDQKGLTPRSTWAFSLDHLRVYIAHYTPEAKQLLVDCFMWCVRENISREDFAKTIGFADNTVYKIFLGKYTHPSTGEKLGVPEKMMKAMRNFLRDEKNRAMLGNTEFVMTPTAKRIFAAVDLARESRTPVFIWGASHLGKTWALEKYTVNNNHTRTIYVRMKAAAGLGGMLHRIAERVGLSKKTNKEALVDRIKKALAPNQVLILDEMHLLMHTYRINSYFACLEVLREIYDEVGCGMVLCGTLLFKNSMANERNGELEQLYRRGVHKFILPPEPTAGDVKAILEASGLEMPDKSYSVRIGKIIESPYEILRLLSKTDGLKSITERIRYARKLARGEEITIDDFVKAHLYIQAEDQSNAGDWQ